MLLGDHAAPRCSATPVCGDDDRRTRAAMTIALTHYDIGYLEDGRKNLIQAIEEGHSVTPRDAIRRMSTSRPAVRPRDVTLRSAKRAVHLRFTNS